MFGRSKKKYEEEEILDDDEDDSEESRSQKRVMRWENKTIETNRQKVEDTKVEKYKRDERSEKRIGDNLRKVFGK